MVEGTAQAHTWSTDEARYVSRPELLKPGGEQKDALWRGAEDRLRRALSAAVMSVCYFKSHGKPRKDLNKVCVM